MNNVDVSIINVLKASNPEIFSQYFSLMGTTPNPNQKTRREASKLFQMHSSESFDSFMQRYRNWINEPRDRNLDQFNVSTQTNPDPVFPQSNADFNASFQRAEEDEIPDILEIRSLFFDPRQNDEEQEFEALPFLKKKSLYRDYTYLDFQLNEDWINSTPNEVSDMDNMSSLLKMLNAIHNYKVLELYEVNIQRKVEEWNLD